MKKTFIIIFILFFACFGMPHMTNAKSAPPEYVHANQLFGQGRYFDAIRLYRSILSSPTNSMSPGILYTRIADSYFKLKDYEHALSAYRTALYSQKQDERAQTQYWIGLSELLLGRYDEAVADFLKIPEQYPASGMWVGTAYYWAGRTSERMGKKEQAVEFYRKAGGNGKSTQGRFAIQKAKAVKAK